MDLGPGWEQWETWELSEREVRALWKFARQAEWSAWNPAWRQYSCPVCGEPESMKRHARTCGLALTLARVLARYPDVTSPPKMDVAEELASMDFQHLFLGQIQEHLRRAADDPTPKEKGPDESEPPRFLPEE